MDRKEWGGIGMRWDELKFQLGFNGDRGLDESFDGIGGVGWGLR